MTTLALGSRLGVFEIRELLGAGGMGEVYRAYDTKLDRQVAIKILAPVLAADSAALARFEREAKAVAALSHPNILAIHDFGRDGANIYAVMELLEGETLRVRLAAGALPVRKAVDVGKQIAYGLAAAHSRGIIHRDLKPDNVFLSASGHVKILDFGLAKAMNPDPSSSETIAIGKDDTTPGMVVGTVGYMSPEQIKGAPVDARTDIFAFGAVAYEMVSGRRAFARPSTAETMAAILKEDAPELPAASGVPPPLERIVRRCLEKNPEERFHSAHDLAIVLESLADRSVSATTHEPKSADDKWRVRTGVVAALLGAVALVALIVTVWPARSLSTASGAHVRKFHVPAPQLVASRETRPVMSPDGEKIAFAAGNILWIQELNQLDPRQVATSWRPERVFWSPDSAFIGFISERKLWKVAVAGGNPIPLGDVPTTGGGALGVWRADGKIVFSRSVSNSGLLEIPQDGGEMRSIVELQEGDVDLHEPALLPDDSGYLLVVHRKEGPDTIAVVRGQTRKPILRLAGEQLTFPQYSPTGHLIFARQGKAEGIWAVDFDRERLETTGEPFLIAPGGIFPSVTNDGTLTFIRRIWSEPRQLVVVNRKGTVDRTIGESLLGADWPVVAPDGRRIAIGVGPRRQKDVWLVDTNGTGRRRLTFLESDAVPVTWISDNLLLVSHTAPGTLRRVLVSQSVVGNGETEQLGEGYEGTISKDEKFMVFTLDTDSKEAGRDLYYRVRGEATPKIFLSRNGVQTGPQFSPDSKYVAYHSNESGRDDVYVRPFPTGSGQWQVSMGGGADPQWSPTGDKLWFRGPGNTLMEARITVGTTTTVGEPVAVFKADAIGVDLTLGFTVLDDGEKFVGVRRLPDPDGSTPSIAVIQNWFEEFANRRSSQSR